MATVDGGRRRFFKNALPVNSMIASFVFGRPLCQPCCHFIFALHAKSKIILKNLFSFKTDKKLPLFFYKLKCMVSFPKLSTRTKTLS